MCETIRPIVRKLINKREVVVHVYCLNRSYCLLIHSAKGGHEQKIYSLDLEFFKEVNPEVR